MMKITGSSDGNDEVKQGIGQGNINEHVHPVLDGADYHQENGGLGTDHVNAHDPVNGSRAMDRSVQCQKHQKAKNNAYTDKKRIHISPRQKLLPIVLPFHLEVRQLPCG